MTQDPNSNAGPVARRNRRGLRVALVLSVMVNVLLVGVLAGGVIRLARFDPVVQAQPDFRSLWRALPDEARDELRAMSHGHGEGGMRPSREERRERAEQVNAHILEMLRAEPFDAQAFAALLGTERAALAQRLGSAQTAFADRVAGLSAEQRHEMAESLEQTWNRRAPH